MPAAPPSAAAPRRDSPRTPAEPYAFTRSEFLAGTGRAWGGTTLIIIVVWAVLTGGFSLTVGSVMILLASLPAVAIGSPGAYGIGRLLRRSPRVRVHLVVFAAYGAAIGALTTALVVPAFRRGSAVLEVSPVFFLVNVPLSAVGVAGAWLVTMRRARRVDVGGLDAGTEKPDADARFEDELDERYRVIDPRQRPRG